jgi:hypothetical protein
VSTCQVQTHRLLAGKLQPPSPVDTRLTLSDDHHSAHALWDIKYHLVWITNYRLRVLPGDIAERAPELIGRSVRRGRWRSSVARCRPTIATSWWATRW